MAVSCIIILVKKVAATSKIFQEDYMEFSRSKKLQELIDSKGNHMIKIVTGLRRCGKSYLLDHIFKNYLLSQGVKERHIISFAFDFDEDIDKLEKYFPEEPTKIPVKGKKDTYVINSKKFRAYIQDVTKEKGDYYLLLDEVQILENFAGTLNGFLRHEEYDVYVTGSNSKFLSSDIATEFRGRGDVIHLYPLTFKEIYETCGGDKSDLLDSVLRYGGLPLCVLSETDEQKEKYLLSAYDTIYARDILERRNIKHESEFKELTEITASSVGSLTNTEKIANTFRSKENSSISSNTVSKYLSALEDAFVISKANRYDVKGRKYIASPCKFYFGDLGIRNAIISFRQFERTHLMENLIYNELLARNYQVDVGMVEKYVINQTGTYTQKNLEIDFVANKGSQRFYIQSAFSIEDEDKRIQEESSLGVIDDSFKKVIIVYGSMKPYYNEKGYLIIGLIDFLLDENALNK